MKNLFLCFCFLATIYSVNAQVKTPQPSPFSTITQTVGLTDFTLEYSRPSMRGRAIFGDLVPYGKVWRTGANENTKITFSNDVTIKGKSLKKGTYAIYTIPNKTSWDVIFYTDVTNWGNPKNWDESKVALKTTAEVFNIPMEIETFTITFDNLTNNSFNLSLLWENTYIEIPFQLETDKMVTENIENAMSGPSSRDYYNAASYYLQENKDINKAKMWINKAVEMTSNKPLFYYLRKQALILEKSGDINDAIKAAKASLIEAEKAGNDDYIKMNKEFLSRVK